MVLPQNFFEKEGWMEINFQEGKWIARVTDELKIMRLKFLYKQKFRLFVIKSNKF